jgi:hypothetical protein
MLVPFVPVHDQLLVPPVVLFDSTILGPLRLHTDGLDGVAEAVGSGLTVTVCVSVEPVHPTALVNIGVITYVAVCGTTSELVSVWFIKLPVELLAPVIFVPFVPVHVQLLVPPEVVLLDNPIFAPVRLQIVGLEGVAATIGLGLTVIVKLVVLPLHNVVDGVTVTVPVSNVAPVLEAVKDEMFPLPLAPKPILVVVFDQE